MGRIIRALINLARRPEAVRFPIPPPGAVVGAVMHMPRFKYDIESFDPEHEEMPLLDYINGKAAVGWKLHTIQQSSYPGGYKYFLTWESLDREPR